jgi:uncharacterized repeat protein (TIGR01451 family)
MTAEAVTADGMHARRDATTRVEPGKLSVLVEPPPVATAGETATIRVAVTNAGATAVPNVALWTRFDDGLKHASGRNPVETTVGTLAPGKTETFDVPLTATATGRYAVRATATADGGVSAGSDPAAVDVRRAELKAAVTGPQLAYLNQEFAWAVSVGNAGDVGVSNVVVRATLPPEVRVKDPGDARVVAGSAEWAVGTLRPGEQRTFKLTFDAVKLTDRAGIMVVAQGDPGGGGGDPVQARAEAAVAVIGTAAVVLELATPPGLVEVGKRVLFQVRVRNRGTVSARNVEVVAVAPAELRVVRGFGKADGRLEPDGKVVFPTLEELRPGESVTYTVEVDATQPGDARFRAEVKAAHLKNPLREEQATRVVSR